MDLFIDCRENSLISVMKGYDISFNVCSLNLGDIVLNYKGNEIIYIERKTFKDLLSSIKDSRFMEQSYRLSNSLNLNTHSIIYLLEGDLESITDSLERKIIYSSITSLYYFKGFTVMRTKNINETAELIYNLSEKIKKELNNEVKSYEYIKQPIKEDISGNGSSSLDYCKVVKKVKKENVVKENIGQIMLSQIPGISSNTAIAILKDYESITEFILKLRENPNILNEITTESKGKKRKLSKTVINKIKEFLI